MAALQGPNMSVRALYDLSSVKNAQALLNYSQLIYFDGHTVVFAGSSYVLYYGGVLAHELRIELVQDKVLILGPHFGSHACFSVDAGRNLHGVHSRACVSHAPVCLRRLLTHGCLMSSLTPSECLYVRWSLKEMGRLYQKVVSKRVSALFRNNA